MDLIFPASRTITVESIRRCTLGVDLAKLRDYTALALVTQVIEGSGRWEIDGAKISREVAVTRYECNRVRRLRHGADWPEIVQEVAAAYGNVLRYDSKAALVIDNNGVGGPIVDEFRRAGLRPIGISTHGGMDTRRAAFDDYRVPKLELIRRLEAGLKSGDLQIAVPKDTDANRDVLADLQALRQEVTAFQLYYTAAGRISGESPVGEHDDMFMALAMAYWFASLPRETAREVPITGW